MTFYTVYGTGNCVQHRVLINLFVRPQYPVRWGQTAYSCVHAAMQAGTYVRFIAEFS
jgi:hypothetical protein